MPTQYTSVLKLALPVTGEISGTWGDVVNDNITSMIEQAIAGLATINTWTTNAHTLTTANGTSSESRCAMLVADDDGLGNPSAAATIICPAAAKLYVLKNISGQAVTLRPSAGTGVSVPNNQTAFLFCDGVNVNICTTSFVDLYASGTVNLAGLTQSTALALDSSKNIVSVTNTGTGSNVLANSPTLVTPNLGTPSTLVGTNITGTAAGLTAGAVTTNANLTGAVTSTGNTTSLGSFSSSDLRAALTDETGTGAAVFANSPTLVTPNLGTPASATLTNATGLPISTGVSGLGTGVATALAVNVGSAGAPVVNGGALGTPSSGTVTNLTGTASININGTVGATTPTTGAFTTLTSNSTTTLNGTTIPSSVTLVSTAETQTLTNKTMTNMVFDGDYTEEVFTITDGSSVDLDPSNGTIQLWTLGASRSPTASSFASGQSMTLMIDDGSAYAITWPSVTWKTNAGLPPTLNTTGFTVVQLWKVSSTLYGARVGDA